MSMTQSDKAAKQLWEKSFEDQVAQQAYNTAPVEALARTMAYYLRARHADKDLSGLHMMEMGCGAGPNLLWLAKKGIKVSGVDISPTALQLARKTLADGGCESRVGELVESSVTRTPFDSESFDGIFEACVFQHLNQEDRQSAFAEVVRLLKPGGVFVGYMLADAHTTFQSKKDQQLPEDPGTIVLEDGGPKFYLTNIGLAHFFNKEEYQELFKGCSVIDPCATNYYLPQEEAQRRGYDHYLQSMWTVYVVK